MAEKNRVYEVAKVHGVSSKALLAVLQELGVVAKSHMSVLTDEDLELVEKHFTQLEARGEKVVEKSQRVVVEKAKPKPKRMSAREKLEAKRKEKEQQREVKARAKKAAPDESEAETGGGEPEVEAKAKKPRLKKVQAFKPDRIVPSDGADVQPEPEAAEPEGRETPETGVAPKSPPRTQKTVDLGVIAKAAARTRAQIADDMRTRMAEPETPRPARPKRNGETKPARREPRGQDDAKQPRPIDPNAIRSSVRKALGGMTMPRSAQRGGRSAAAETATHERRRGGRQIREEKREKVARHRAREEALQVRENELRITEYITVQELAEKLQARPQDLIMKLMGLGVMATMNQRLERDQIELLVSEYEEIEIHWLDTAAGEDLEIVPEERGEALPRPPVVTVMGHVDHGKTTLLDYLRHTKVTEGEAGGITQHIGAYQIETPRGRITFLDTPGHEAFTAMRARGAKVTDIVVIVVAADDKVMPQTVEAIDHARASHCPIIIAINKIDLPGADPAGVKQALMQHNVLVEEFGGDVQCVEISAKKGVNIDALLEAIALQSEILELKAPADGYAEGTVVEARKDIGRGAVFTVLVSKGTLKVGDAFVAGSCDGRVRAMLDEYDQVVEEAVPARPVLVLGASDVPEAGDRMNVLHSDSEAREIARRRQRLRREQALHAPKKKVSLESLFDRMQEQELVELNLLVKGDVSGSVEAVCDSLMGLSNEKVAVHVIHRGVGGINENDVMLAAASDAIIVGFNLHPDPATRNLAKAHNVDLKLYDVIYEAVEEVKSAMKGMLAPVDKEITLGSAEVRQLFRVPKVGTIAGSYVIDGEVKRNARVRVVRDQVKVYEGSVSSLKRFKDDVRSVATNFECGIGVEGFDDIKVGDILEFFEITQVAQEM